MSSEKDDRTDISEIFTNFQQFIDSDQETREEIRSGVKELEQSARDILSILQRVHNSKGLTNIGELCSQSRQIFTTTVQTQFTALAQKIPHNEYYKYHDHWRFVIQRLSFLAALLVYLETEGMVTLAQTATLLGVSKCREAGFHLDLEDYLTGLLHLASELSRLSVNCVTARQFTRPLHISRFLGDLNNGFRLLNLKNDSLRKRYDALKYDLKKAEEVVYDLSLRNLIPSAGDDLTD